MTDTPVDEAPVEAEPAPAEPEVDAEEVVSRLDALHLDDPDSLRRAVEAVLFVVDAPVGAEALAAGMRVQLAPEDVVRFLALDGVAREAG